MKLQMAKNAFSASAAKTDVQRLGQSKQMMNVKMAAMKASKNHDTLNINGREMSTANLNAIMTAKSTAAMAKATYTLA
jgi:hypothetical protein